MIDIHCHILSGTDDGSGTMRDSIEMAQIAQVSGVCGVIATPHSNLPGDPKNFWSAEMESRVTTLQMNLRRLGVNISLYPGQEIFLSSGYMEKLRDGMLIGLNHSRYLLVEFDMQEKAWSAYRKLQQISAEGYVPVVAHPERYGFVQEDMDAAIRIKEVGGLLQLNKGSLKGGFGRRAMTSAHRILKQHMADFIASDAHSPYRRTPFLAEIHEMISEQYSYEYAELLLKTNPTKVINNLEISCDSYK